MWDKVAVGLRSSYSDFMVDEKDMDKLDREARPVSTELLGSSGGGGAGGPQPGAGEPVDDNPQSQRQQLLDRIEEKESALAYMGQGHPKKSQFEHELATMKRMLEQIDAAMGGFGES